MNMRWLTRCALNAAAAVCRPDSISCVLPLATGCSTMLASRKPQAFSAGFVTACSSAFGYLTPAAQPAFTIIYASGYLKGSDFFKIGLRMMLISFVVLLVLATFYWPMLRP